MQPSASMMTEILKGKTRGGAMGGDALIIHVSWFLFRRNIFFAVYGCLHGVPGQCRALDANREILDPGQHHQSKAAPTCQSVFFDRMPIGT